MRIRSFLAAVLVADAALLGAYEAAVRLVPTAQAQAPADPAGLAQAQADDVVAKVQAVYDRTTNYQADFAQQYFIKQYNKREDKHGHVVFDKPAKMNWTYDAPAGNRVVSDGHKLRVYQPADRQMFESDVSATQYPAALSFLTGQGRLADAFNFTLYDGSGAGSSGALAFPGGYVLAGAPKTATPAYQRVFMYVDKATWEVRRVLIIDGQGNHNRFDFANPHVVTEKERTSSGFQSQFFFTPPAGTTTIRP
jgi:outer membrane lipoprotein carrier protein